MAHPEHDQVIGQLVRARLRGVTARPSGGGAGDVHPDAETWAAYVDSGLRADDVLRLETHLAGCATCRRLVAALAPEVSALGPAVRDGEAPATARAAVIPFPRRPVFAWMALAAGAFVAVTLWSVSRLGGNDPVAAVVQSRTADPLVTPSETAPTAGPSAARPAPQERDAAKRDARGDAPTRQTVRDVRARAGVSAARDAAGGPMAAAADQPAAESNRFSAGKASEEKRTADAAAPPADAPARLANGRDIQLQTNAATAGAAKPHGPSATQQAGSQQATTQQAPTQPARRQQARTQQVTDEQTAAPQPASAPAAQQPATPVAAPAGNEPSGLAESVTIAPPAGARRATRAERRQAAKDARKAAARAKDEAAKEVEVGALAAAPVMPAFAEPGGRLQWRIAGGRRIESSSDGGTTWKGRFTARGRLRAGVAPSIDSAWVVGEHGVVVRFAVPGEWSVVRAPSDVTLVAVTAAGAQSARVTAADGGAFETADGGATWTPVAGGAGPP